MAEERAEHLPPGLEHAVRLLREEEPVAPAWRGRVLHAVATDDGREPGLPQRRLIPLRWAIAAALVCAAGGSAITVVALRRVVPSATVASNTRVTTAASPVLLPVHFSLVAPSAASVSIVGDFNHWSPTALPMKRSSDGRTWEIDVRIPEGRYNYAYLVDGRIARDPSAPQTGGDDFGMPNSVLMVSGT